MSVCSRLNSNLKVLVFKERRKLEYLEKTLSKQGRKPINKPNPHMASTPGFKPGPHWWEASALTISTPLPALLTNIIEKKNNIKNTIQM